MIFVDGRGGSCLLTALILAPLLSIFLTLYVKKQIEFDTRCSATLLNKGDVVDFTVIASKKGKLPVPFLEFELFCTPQLSPKEIQKFRITLGSGNTEKITSSYKADFWGLSRIGIKSISISDFLGFVSFSVYKNNGLNEYSSEIRIHPNIHDVSVRDVLLTSLQEKSAFNDSEETTEKTSLSFSGIPGYDHREYIPGDSLKKVNWKLSAKKDSLFVRLDESISPSKQAFVLDKKSSLNIDLSKMMTTNQTIAEGTISLLYSLVKQENPCVLFWCPKNVWEYYSIETPVDIDELKYALSAYSFSEKPESTRIPLDLIKEKGYKSLTVFSACPDNSLSDELSLALKENFLTSAVTDHFSENLSCEQWVINSTSAVFEFLKNGGDSI